MANVVKLQENELKEQKIGEILESIVINGDLSKLSPKDKVFYYNKFCESLGLNPLTKPFQLLKLQGKEVLYATKDATEQLRKKYGVSVKEMTKEIINEILVVTVKVQDKDGREDIATGAVPIGNAKDAELANLIMKAETKAKRRATLSICGLGILDESELDTLNNYEKVDINSVEKEEIESKLENEIKALEQLGLKGAYKDGYIGIIEGDTFKHKNILKNMGYKINSKTNKWYKKIV
ncbi:hypothetical protein [Deferribacter abyssi]|uniref:hypothetical protein n=1 Tax=Deferribacter abyssi TaxID=213806 RepID=UPI003C14348B